MPSIDIHDDGGPLYAEDKKQIVFDALPPAAIATRKEGRETPMPNPTPMITDHQDAPR